MLATTSLLNGEGKTCALGMLYATNTDRSALECTQKCSEKVKDCTLCSSAEQCTLCSDANYVPSQFKTSDGTSYSHCTTEVCVDCGLVTCSDANCDICSNTDTSKCKVCKQGYHVKSDGTCELHNDATPAVIKYYVQAPTVDKILYSSSDMTAINSAVGSTSDKFTFLQQVFNAVINTASLVTVKDVVTVQVELDVGDHYFFSCHNDLYSSYTWTNVAFTDLCAGIANLRTNFPISDHINFEFKGAADTGAIVNVLDSGAYFNITGSMKFENIEFRGENALAAPVDASLSSFLHPPLAIIPTKKCSVATAPDGTHSALSFTLSTSVSALDNLFKCSDSGFEAATIPMATNVTCTQTDYWSTTLGGVRTCSGEPYHSDFFTFDSVTHMPYKRHKVLFNLYNWDPRRAY